MNLDKYEDLESVKKMKEHLSKYYTVRHKSYLKTSSVMTTRDRLKVTDKLEELDLDDITGDLNIILEKLTELNEDYEYIHKGDLVIKNKKHFWQGDYEGEDWLLLDSYEELDEDYKERMDILDDIEKDIAKIEKRKNKKQSKKEYEEYLKLKEKFEGDK